MDRNIMDEPDFDLFGLFDEIDNAIFGTLDTGIDLAAGVEIKNVSEASTSSGVKNVTEEPSKSKEPTFINITDEEKENFVSGMRNVNTVRKTESSIRVFQQWLAQPPRNDHRNICSIMPPELNNYIGSFLLSVRKADGSDYEPDTLTSYHFGIDRYLRENKYPFNTVKDKEFAMSRAVLASKRKELKGKGKDNRQNAAK